MLSRRALRLTGLSFSVLSALLCPPLAGAEETAVDQHACGEPIQVRLSSAQPRQGSILLIEVQSSTTLSVLEGEWAGQKLHFWPSGNPERVYRALVGVDLGRAARIFSLVLQAELEGGERLSCSVLTTVKEGDYGVDRLRVSRRFVEPSARDLERIKQESQRLRTIFATVTPERLWEGGFELPLRGIEATGNFGRRRFFNNQPRSSHSGEDFPGPLGTPVYAPQRGRVVLAEALFFSGKTVILDHGLGLLTYYAHLDSIAVPEGELVTAGTLLGQVGASGRVTGAHLHWAARLNRARVNPRDLVELPLN